MSDASPAVSPRGPQAPLGHLSHLGFALVGAAGVDEIATALFTDLAALPGVRRIGFALSEGGGRRLRFTASDRSGEGGRVDWCHIDAYDDVPLTLVARTGEAVLGARDELAPRFDSFVAGQPDEVRALAAVPLPGIGSPIGGLVVFLEDEWAFDEAQRRLLEATARRVSEAVRRIRVGGSGYADDEPAYDDDAVSARIVLDDDPRSAGAARRFLREFLDRAQTSAGLSDDLAATAELCLSELVTNAIVHGGSRTELRATLDTTLTVSVRDRGGAAHPGDAAPDSDADPLRVHGRGLLLVEALADRWGSERDAGGTTVWFSLELEGAHPGASETG